MVYSSPESDYQDNIFSIQGPESSTTSSQPSVVVQFNGTGLHSIAGPVPFVNLSKTFNRNGANQIESIETTITINGKIVRANNSGVTPAGTGTAAILGAISGLQNLFSCSTVGTLQILCNGSGLTATGVRVNSFNVNRTDDNWIFTADYEAILAYNEVSSGNPYPPVKSSVDNWNIEPLEDSIYMDIQKTLSVKSEYHNPLMRPAPGYGTSNGLGQTTSASQAPTNPQLRILNIPQFKLSRRLSAVGFPISSTGNAGCSASSGNYTAYLQAKEWVKKKLAESFLSNPGISGLVTLPNGSSGNNLYLYNHLRTINFSVTEGSYETNDTWLAMPTGINYIEDYTLEVSTDERFIKTVRVQGNIKGLYHTISGILSGSSGLPPGTGGIQGEQKLDLNYSIMTGEKTLSSPPNTDITGVSINNQIQSKYENALSGWLNDIKPYLYRRASLAVNVSVDRNDEYIPATTTPQPAPKNPIYCRENLLNIIPISTSEGHDPRKGTISYSYEYSNRFNFISGVLSENISINDTGPTDVVSEAFVLGRRLGPILQSLGTTSSAKRDLTFEIVVVPPSSLAGFPITNSGCPLYTGGVVYQTITGMIEGLKPYGDRTANIFGNAYARSNQSGQVFKNRDDQSWNPVEGRYTRSIGWTYQPCNNTQIWYDN